MRRALGPGARAMTLPQAGPGRPDNSQVDLAGSDDQVTGVLGRSFSPAEPRRWVPGYFIDRELGRGGMGVVYLARQLGLDRHVAVKMMLAGAHASAEELARFHHEIQTIGRLRHPNIVQI